MPNIVASEENEPRLPFFLSVFPSDLPAVSILHRRSSSYYRLPSHLLKLTVLKLDGTSFDVQVSRTASVRELKAAVENVFGQSRDRIKESISWTHVWGQFCLSYGGLKLIDEKALLKNFGIKDSDQLQFIRHLSVSSSPGKHHQGGHATSAEWRRSEFIVEDSATENKNKELIPASNEDAGQSVDQCKAVIFHLQSKLCRYFRGWLCYSNPLYTRRASSGYRTY